MSKESKSKGKTKANKEGCEGSTGKCGWATISQVIYAGDKSWTKMSQFLKGDQSKMLDELRVLECGGHGNCGYYVVASGLNMNPPGDKKKPDNWKQSDVRDWLVSMLTPSYLTGHVLDDFKRHYFGTINESEFDRVARDYQGWLEDKKKAAGKKKFPKFATEPDDGSPDSSLITFKFKYGEASFADWMAEGIFDEVIFAAYLTYVCDKDKAEFISALQRHAKHYSWQMDAFVMQVLSDYPVIKSRHITLVSVSTEHTNQKNPIFVSVFPSFDLVAPTEDRRYLLCYNEGRTHWQLLGKQVSAGKYQSLFSFDDLPLLIKSYMNMDVDERARAYFSIHGAAGIHDGTTSATHSSSNGSGSGSGSEEKKGKSGKRGRSQEKEPAKGKEAKEKKRRTGTEDAEVDLDMSSGKETKGEKSATSASGGHITFYGVQVPLPRVCDVQGKSAFDIRLDHGDKKTCHDGAQLKFFLAAVRANVLMQYYLESRTRPNILQEMKRLKWNVGHEHVSATLVSLLNNPTSVAKIDSFTLYREEAHLQTRELVQRLINLLQASKINNNALMFCCIWLHFHLISAQNSTAHQEKGRKYLASFVVDDEAATELLTSAQYYAAHKKLSDVQKSILNDWIEFGLHVHESPPIQILHV